MHFWSLCKYPNQKEGFFKGYQKYISIPDDFNERMKFYLAHEYLGMIDFFNQIGDTKTRDEAILTLTDVVNKTGVITELLN